LSSGSAAAVAGAHAADNGSQNQQESGCEKLVVFFNPAG
jgi:hypothetical protein